jgi:hypothetical protein
LIEPTVMPGDLTINTRARLAHRLTHLVEIDHRVRRCRLIEFAEDGGVLLALELPAGIGQTAGHVIARELELQLAARLPALPWVRVQPNLTLDVA